MGPSLWLIPWGGGGVGNHLGGSRKGKLHELSTYYQNVLMVHYKDRIVMSSEIKTWSWSLGCNTTVGLEIGWCRMSPVQNKDEGVASVSGEINLPVQQCTLKFYYRWVAQESSRSEPTCIVLIGHI